MFLRLLIESFLRQRRRKLLAGLAIFFGITAITAMLALGTSVGDKVNRELASYGANITVYPRADTLDVEIGGVSIQPATGGNYLKESDLPRLKSIFWANNITGISPELPLPAQLQTSATATTVPALGLWFHHTVTFGKTSMTTGAPALHKWWKLTGSYPSDSSLTEAALGSTLAAHFNLHPGDTVQINNQSVRITGIVSSGDETDTQILIPLALAQQLSGHPDAVRRVSVSALTKPEDAFARRNPDKLSPAQHDRWYCSPYANSIAYQIREALPNAQAEQIRRVAQSEGKLLARITGLMWLVTIASLLAASFAVTASMATAVLERRREIGLMRSLGASQTAIALLFFSETALLSLIAGSCGYLLGSLIANRIGERIFSSSIPLNPVLLPVVLALAILVAILGSTPSVRSALRLDPTAVLRADA